MRWVDVFQGFLVVFPSLAVDVLVLLLDLDGEDLHAVDEFLGVGRVVFGEVHVHKASEGVSICAHPDDSVLVGVSVDDLLLQSSSFVSGALVAAVLSIDGVSVEDPFPLVGVELLHGRLLLLLDPCLVLRLKLPDLRVVALLETQVLLHHAVHVAVVHVHHHDLLALLQGFVLVLQAQLLAQLFLEPAPLILVV